MRNRGWMVMAAMLLASCSPGADLPLGDKAIEAFHADMNAGRFAAIYDASGKEMKSATTREGLTKLLAAIHGKLGPFKSGSRNGWNDNVNTNGHFLTLNYSATYQKGAGEEEFVYRIEGGKAVLIGYHINSQALITN